MRRALLVAVAIGVLLLSGCSQSHYAYEIINDSPDELTAVQAGDPNFMFMKIDMVPYQGGARITVDGHPPRDVEIRWTPKGQPTKAVRVNTYVDFIPCETDLERTRRIANEKLAQAAADGDLVRLDAALKDAPVNPAGYFDPAPLHLAVRAGHLHAVQDLIRRGAHIEVPQRWASPSALSLAIADGHLQIAAFLIESGADLNGALPGAPLLVAAEKGDIQLVERMLNRGADVSLTAFGQSAIVNAAREGHVALVAFLLERGADPNTLVGGTSASALDIAEQFDHREVAALLGRHGGKRGSSIRRQ